MYRLFKYFYFLIKSKNEHAVHSPFAFNLITRALHKRKVPKKIWIKYLGIKKSLLKNNQVLDVTDFGATSKRLKSNQRIVNDIVQIAGISNKRAKILYQIINYFKPKKILEIGTSVGLSSTIISLASKDAEIITIEGCKNTLKVANQVFQNNNLENISSVCGKFEDVLPKILDKNSFDFVFIDGNHTKEATINYFETLLTSINNNSCLIFDDIYWSKGMQEAWKYIQKHPKVTLSIDTFQWGIVFFRKEQQKEHFVIRV